MKMKRLTLCLCLLITSLVHSQEVQQNFLDSLSAKLITEIRSDERPKAVLASDKSIYKPAETIWFRGFLLNSVTHKVTSQNKYLFVDLVNEKDSVISMVLLNAANQQLNGKIILPDQLMSGYYWLRAYTRQMAQADTGNAFVQPVYITGAKQSLSQRRNAKTPGSNNDPVMKFYPEGGVIMTGANSSIAFEIKDGQGKPFATEGYIKDNRDTIAARFTADQSGTGKFTLLTAGYRKYKAYINFNGKEISYPLPPFNFRAGQISVTRQAGGNNVLRILLEDSIYKKDLVTYVIGVSNDSLCFAAIGTGQYEINVPDQKFPEGIATFYLFNDKGKYLSERSIYVNESAVTVKASTDKTTYTKREKVSLNLSVTDAANHVVPSLVSISVIDTAFADKSENNRMPDLSEGSLFDNFNLSHSVAVTDEHLDLLMLLKDTYVNRKRNALAKSNGFDDSLLFIKGTVMDKKDKPGTGKILTLFSSSGFQTFLTDTSDNKGQFSFPVFDYADSTQFAIEAKNINNTNADVKIVREPDIFPRFNTPVSLKHYFSSEPVFTGKYRNAYLDTPEINLEKGMLKGVMVTGKRKVSYNESLRVSPSSIIIAGDQLDESTPVGTAVLKVGGVHMLQGFMVINGLTAIGAPGANSEPLLLINGIEVTKPFSFSESPLASALNSINPKDVDFIEILRGSEGSNYGLRGGNGVILINLVHTRKENFSHEGNNIQTFYAKGISTPAQFPNINYDNKQIRSSQYFDNRSTVFWNGSVLTGSEDHNTITFFTNDVPTTYKVIIRGVTVHGDVIYKTLFFDSK